MNRTEIKEILSTVIYPRLNKSITELQLIDSIKEHQESLEIVLSILDDEMFALVSEQIENTVLTKKYAQLDIKKKQNAPKKSMNYGSTQSPNNRAAYAKKIIAVTSGKGGVGKSTVSANIAVALAQEGYKIGILDADVYGPNIPRFFGVEKEKMQWNEHNKIIPSENFGVKIMSVGLTTPRADTPLVWRSSVAISALIQFLEDVAWGELDFLVIDMPPGTGDVQLTMAQELPITSAVIVTTPQQVALDDVSRAIMMFKDINVPIGGLVENMSYFIAPDTKKQYDIFGSGAGEKLANEYAIPFLGKIPLEIEIREYCDKGKLVVALGTDAQKAHYKEIASNLFKSL
ncbi:Mrp/NBP35 family ATP-binding protein [Candidatus Marinarcus aquaticus]|uniref:Iron-sulfur cluster carrier protein n=1 Tax=Candidatus Marinarcus aquaticus TaxID=2044504 RepID=A0A4Q0XNG4_9BACT|nr:Mrp/NBP35 family ATP-binding protein [Candidatus Marinarcus aquaticus]RXJ55459.1 ATP-binding protein [Candidatus Marinarcus aquaticus]